MAERVKTEPVYQHQQTLESPVPSKVAEKVQFNLDQHDDEPTMSTLPVTVSSPAAPKTVTAAATPSSSAADEIKQLKTRLADALKQIEILSRYVWPLSGQYWSDSFALISIISVLTDNLIMICFSTPPASSSETDQPKMFMILLFVAFLTGTLYIGCCRLENEILKNLEK